VGGVEGVRGVLQQNIIFADAEVLEWLARLDSTHKEAQVPVPDIAVAREGFKRGRTWDVGGDPVLNGFLNALEG